MRRRLAVNLTVALSLAALLGAGCSRSGDSTPADTGTRPLAAIWADILTQRDQIHMVFMEDLEDVTHDDCARVGAAARRIDDLFSELVNHLGAKSGGADPGRVRSLGDTISRASTIIGKVRETALSEAPGAWPNLRFPLDQSLREIETYFSADELGRESVLGRPGFEAQPLPPPASPI
jgi:hypothetical protein